MKKWEYKIATNLDNGDLIVFGKEGWELVTIIRTEGKTCYTNWYYFKREIEV